jgi:ABC-2 type transport system ATP-binding protein
MSTLIEARALTKAFGKVRALEGLELSIPSGRIVAILGPNGAGKSTFVRMLATILSPDAGRLAVLGHDVVAEPEAVRRLIGLAGQSAAVEAMMTGRENLAMVARLYGATRRRSRQRATEVLEQLDLARAADRQVKTYSGGMRRRLDLGASLVGEPRLLLLDEPTTGLDPRSRIELWDAIRALGAAGTDIVLTTQYLDEADQLAAQMVIIDGGRVIAEGTSAELKSMAGTDRIELHTRDTESLALAASVLSRAGIGEPSVDPAVLRCSIAAVGGSDLLTMVVRALDDAGLAVEDITMRRPTLDEVFLSLTGRPSLAAGAGAGDRLDSFLPTDTGTDIDSNRDTNRGSDTDPGKHSTHMVTTTKEDR